MKCPRCWAEKAYLRTVPAWKRIILACLLTRPMKCRHCFHKFWVPWVLTLGKQVRQPILRIAPMTRSADRSHVARHHDATQRPIVPIRRSDTHDPARRKAA